MALVGLQFAVASFLAILMLVVAAENQALRSTALGTKHDPLLTITNDSVLTHVAPTALRRELLRLPQVASVTEVGGAVWQTLSVTSLRRSLDEAAPTLPSQLQAVGLDFFATFDIPVLAGRPFGPAFESYDAPPAGAQPPDIVNVVVNREFARLFGFASPAAAVGQDVYLPQRLMAAFGDRPPPPWRIVGVVEDKPLTFANARTTAVVYRFNPQLPIAVARLRADTLAAGLEAIDATWQRLAPDVSIGTEFVDESFEQAYRQYGQLSRVFTALALFALAISVVGLVGMAVLVTARRLPEIGLRKALGASTSQVVGMLLGGFSKPVVIANIVAWPLAYIAARAYLGVFLNPIPITPWPFAACLAATLAIAWLAVGSQTWLAARSRPADVLRDE